MPSVRQQILAELLGRVAEIKVENGYQSDAGQKIFFGEVPQLGPDDPDEALAVLVRDDLPSDQSGYGVDADGVIVTMLPVELQAIVKADLEQPWVTVEAIVSDIKQAIETSDRGLGGLLTLNLFRGRIRALAREPGSTFVGAGVEYRAVFAESWNGGAV